jgi:hypothetical protein
MRAIYTTILFITLFLTGCTDRAPYAKEIVAADQAVVYVYRKYTGYDMDSTYRLHVNDKLVKGVLNDKAYMHFALAPGEVTINAEKDIINQHSIKFVAKAGESYYVQMASTADTGAFDMKLMEYEEGSEAIKETVFHSPKDNIEDYFKDENEKAELKQKAAVSTVPSSADEIERLYDMKEKGILTEDEFNTLKTKVINKQ